MAFSMVLVPGDGFWDRLPDQFAQLWCGQCQPVEDDHDLLTCLSLKVSASPRAKSHTEKLCLKSGSNWTPHLSFASFKFFFASFWMNCCSNWSSGNRHDFEWEQLQPPHTVPQREHTLKVARPLNTPSWWRSKCVIIFFLKKLLVIHSVDCGKIILEKLLPVHWIGSTVSNGAGKLCLSLLMGLTQVLVQPSFSIKYLQISSRKFDRIYHPTFLQPAYRQMKCPLCFLSLCSFSEVPFGMGTWQISHWKNSVCIL